MGRLFLKSDFILNLIKSKLFSLVNTLHLVQMLKTLCLFKFKFWVPIITKLNSIAFVNFIQNNYYTVKYRCVFKRFFSKIT